MTMESAGASEPASPPDQAEWRARVELAALYRLIDLHYGFGEGIYNHISMRVPGASDHFLIKPHALLFREVTASCLIKVHLGADLDESAHVNRPGLTLHGAILSARADVNCAIHIHSTAGLAMSAHKGGLRMLSQNSIRFYRRIGYHVYQGIVEDFSEREQLTAALGARNIALILHNHGLVSVGSAARDAFERMRDLIIACETQLMLEATGAEMIEVPAEICERVSQQYVRHDSGRGAADWPAWLRLLDARDPSFRN
ncbi:MAG TPA: class II aldolase/adducin family protein [Steroidobacteraceae bacterium]|nr:class II aldolase/adducin family protein [Steroidobacteraceae bacterium]